MSDSYTKLFSSITESTIWREPAGTRLVWITMLAMVRRDGIVYASLPGLADRARVTLKETEIAIKALSSPDAYSRTKDFQGRRIEETDGGWLLLNHAKFDAMRNSDERREYMRNLMADRRASEKVLAEKLAVVSNVSPNNNSSSSSSEDQDQKKRKGNASRSKKTEVTFEQWEQSLHAGSDAIPANHASFRFAEAAGIPHEFVVIAWQVFCEKYRGAKKKYADWPAAFTNAVKGNWCGVWYAAPDGGYKLSTVGIQMQRAIAAQEKKRA